MVHMSAHNAAYAGAAADDAVLLIHLQPANFGALADWSGAATRTGWHLVPSPITICGPPQGATVTFLNCPTINMQHFYLFKRFTRPHPWSNYKVALRVHNAGYKQVRWRLFWNACTTLTGPEYKVGALERRKKDPAAVHAGDDGAVGQLVLDGNAAVNAQIKTTNKKIRRDTQSQRGLWRRQQLSQGVLRQLLMMFGRCSTEQVRGNVLCCMQHVVHYQTSRFLCVQNPVIVVDPFMGSGAAGVAALSMGSYFIGVDDDPTIVVLLSCPPLPLATLWCSLTSCVV